MSDAKEISCEDAIRDLLEYLDHECDNPTQEEIDKHLSVCQACHSRMEFEQRLRAQLKKSGERQAPDSLKSRIDTLFAGTNKK